MVDQELLRKIALFKGLNQEEIEAVSEYASIWECRKGQFVFKEGDDAEVLYVVKSGEVAAQISSGLLVNQTVATIKEGEVFGELALIERHPRTASIRCTKNSELISITRDDFRRLGAIHGNFQRVIFKNIARTLAERLRGANEKMKELAGRDKELIGVLPQHFVV